MRQLIGFLILSSVKILSGLLYRGNFQWITPIPSEPWGKARLMVFLNHTSLFEPLYLQKLSFPFLWKLAARMNVPVADVTLERPVVGPFWKLMMPGITPITRKSDKSWTNYLATIHEDSIIIIAPEGRMKRPNGLDKFGRPMTVRGGVADVLEALDEGGMILCLSGGLHHVQAPGQHFPKLFKTINMNLAYLDIKDYKASFSHHSRERKIQIVRDMQRRLENDCPKS